MTDWPVLAAFPLFLILIAAAPALARLSLRMFPLKDSK